MPRHFRRRSSRMAPVIQSYKKVINSAPASRAAATDITIFMTAGKDSVAAGQTSVTDPDVPTGSVIKYIEIQYCVTNLVAISAFFNITIQLVHSGQSPVSPLTVGGSPQRNQVFFQQLFSVGKEQNSTHVYRFKIPKKFQRVREGDSWLFTTNGSVVYTDAMMIIYKFFR